MMQDPPAWLLEAAGVEVLRQSGCASCGHSPSALCCVPGANTGIISSLHSWIPTDGRGARKKVSRKSRAGPV